MSANWRNVGIALRLDLNTLDRIHKENLGRISDCLTAMVTEWLRRNYNVTKFGEPTWQWLVEAVGHPAGGENMAHARDMAGRHKARGMCQLLLTLNTT